MTGPTAAEEIRAAFSEWHIVLADSGYWQADLIGGAERVVAGTLAQLAEALNELVAGTGDPAAARRGCRGARGGRWRVRERPVLRRAVAEAEATEAGREEAMKIVGPVVVAAGAVITFVIGHNYGACQSAWVQAVSSNQAPCQTASTAHLLGIIVMIAGVLLFVLALVTADRPLSLTAPPPPPCMLCQRPASEHAGGKCPHAQDGTP